MSVSMVCALTSVSTLHPVIHVLAEMVIFFPVMERLVLVSLK